MCDLFYDEFLAVLDIDAGGERSLTFHTHEVEDTVVGRTLYLNKIVCTKLLSPASFLNLVSKIKRGSLPRHFIHRLNLSSLRSSFKFNNLA